MQVVARAQTFGTNYVFATNDYIALNGVPVLKKDKIPEAGVNCDPGVRPMVAAHQTERIDVCQSPPGFLGYMTVDELLRAASGSPRAIYNAPARLIGATTAYSASNPFPQFGNYVAAFKKLWRA